MSAEPAAGDPLVSVVTAARNAASTMPALLASLERQTLARDRFELLVVDDCSTDETAEIVRRSGVARLLRTPRWGGAYLARNVALREARGDVIAIIDADAAARPDWLERALAELDSLGADLIAGHIEVPLAPRPTLAELVDFARFLDQRRAVEEAGFGATANLVFRREVMERIGRFNPEVLSAGDREFCWRARDAGFRLAYSEHVAVVHEPRRRARDLARKSFRDGFGRAQILRHGRGRVRGLRQVWRHPGAWMPGALLLGRDIYGMERIRASAYEPSRAEVLRLRLAEWAFVQLPLAAGNVAGALRGALVKGT